MIKETYEFILKGDGIDYKVSWIISESAKSALIKMCRLQGVEGVVKRAIEALDFRDAIELANKFLEWEILNIHTVGDVLYDNPKNNINEIDITDEAESQNGDITEGKLNNLSSNDSKFSFLVKHKDRRGEYYTCNNCGQEMTSIDSVCPVCRAKLTNWVNSV